MLIDWYPSTWIESIPDHHLPEPSHFSDSSTQPSIWGPTPNQTTKAWQHLQARRTLSQKSVAPLKIFRNPKVVFSFALIFIDALLLFLIITFVPYTKIDWDAYMSQVIGFLQGERDYTNLKCDTGPLVYSAGFRVHSIFVFCLFNDCFAVTLLHAATRLRKRTHSPRAVTSKMTYIAWILI